MWAALFVALSPFDILFARTAFTDPLLVVWALGALCAVAYGRWFWAGVCLGLAFATKQHAIVLIPLVLTVGWIRSLFDLYASTRRKPGSTCSASLKSPGLHRVKFRVLRVLLAQLLVGALGFSIPSALVIWWDSVRWAIRPGYWQQSALSYGGLTWAAFDTWGERLVKWLGWTRYLFGPVGLLLLIGGGVLLVRGWQRGPGRQETWYDTAFVGYASVYLLLHTVLEFSVWDRYLLPLVPLVG
jgi:hypothetical protein